MATARHARTLGEAIARHAALRPDAAALVGLPSRCVTFAQLHTSTVRIAAELARAGIAPDDRVGLLVPPGLEGGQLVIGLASSSTLVPISPALTASEIYEACRVSRVKAIVVPRWLDKSARPKLPEYPITLEAVCMPDEGLTIEISGSAAAPTCAAPRAMREADCALLLRTSGTVGKAKLIPVTHGNLLAMADRLSSDLWFKLTSADRAACTLPLYYAMGIKTTLLVPLVLGASVAFPPAGREFDLREWVALLKPTYLALSPAALSATISRLDASGSALQNDTLRLVISGASYLPEDLLIAAESVLRAPVREIYGLSEAGVMSANPLPPGRSKPGTVGLPAPGELLLVDRDRKPVPAGVAGEILVRGPSVTPAYTEGGWLATGDLGCLDEDGYLTIVGRIKEVINRGGEKVFPYEIERALLEHPAVLEAAAFAVPHPRLGESVAAAVVLKPAGATSEHQLKLFLAERLVSFKRPRRLWIVPSLPRSSAGKIQRGSLTKSYATPQSRTAEPHHLLEIELRELWRRLLANDEIGIDDDFLDKGGDSLLAMEMLTAAEELIGKPYPESELWNLTIRHMAHVFTSGLAGERDRMTQVKRGNGVPFFFCHGDFFTRGIYAHRLAALLPHDGPVFLLHCPYDMTPSSIEQIAQAHLREVLRTTPDSPVVVGGFCNGGLAAWHLTHLLRARGVDVLHLLLVETLSLNGRWGFRALAKIFRAAGAMPGRVAKLLRTDGMSAVWTQQRGFSSLGAVVAAALNRLSTAYGVRGAAAPEHDMYQAAQRAYLRLMSRYVPPRIDVNVTCFVADEGRHFDTDPRFWRALAAQVQEVRIPGAHLSALVSERRALAAALAEVLLSANENHLTKTRAYRDDFGRSPSPDVTAV